MKFWLSRRIYFNPKGFALDASHRPHITMLQCFVRTADLDKVHAAVGKVLAGVKVNGMKLEAFKYYYAPAGTLGVLMSRGQHWYDRRTREKTPHRGDRIAILGSGIAVVADVDSEQLHTLLENHSVVRIGRRMVVWNEQNLRWEASPRAGFKNPLKREE